MEKLLDNIRFDIQYKITLKKKDTPVFAYITDADSYFLYLKLNDNTPYFLPRDEIMGIIPAHNSRGASQ